MNPGRVRADREPGEQGLEPAAEPAARPATPVEAVLQLQRTAGNAAVQRALLQRNGPVAVKTPEQDADAAIAAEQWDQLAALLAVKKPWMFKKLGTLTPEQLRWLDDAAQRANLADPWLRTWIKAGLVAKGAKGNKAEPGMAYGKIEGKEGTVKDGDATKSPKENFEYQFQVSFWPDAAEVTADEIAFVQTVRVVNTGTGDNDSPFGKKRMTPDHTKVDRLTGMEQGWYGMGDDEKGGSTLKPWVKGSKDPAWMEDVPNAPKGNRDYHFETSAICRKGADAGKVYAVVTWGFTVDAQLKVTPKKVKIFNKESPEFDNAVAAWNTNAAGAEADRNAPGQKALPDLK
jgi:hypothetical protein